MSSILRDRYASADSIIGALDDHDRYVVFTQNPDVEIDKPHVFGPGDTIRWIDAPGRAAAASIATRHRDQGWPVVIVFDATHKPAMREVADLSSQTLADHPSNHPRAPFAGPHCDRCAAYANARRVWDARAC
jgi:hypothetical protein